ncbi:MAG: hypothetical protein AAGE59_17505 [Cyanobacteria bacterium P01_F01_bin.86]
MVDFEKALNSTVTNSATFDVDAVINKVVDKDIDVQQNVELTGNFANLFGDVEAVGSNTLADAEFSILTIENELSSIAVLAESASQNGEPDPPVATRIGADVVGNGFYAGEVLDTIEVGDPAPASLTYVHEDFDDRNGLLDIEGLVTTGADALNPTGPPLNVGFDELDLTLIDDSGQAGGTFIYQASEDIAYSFGTVEADVVDVDLEEFAGVVDELVINIPAGAQFILQVVSLGDTQLSLVPGQIGAVTLTYGDNVPDLDGDLGPGLWSLQDFEYFNQNEPEIGDYGANFTTVANVVSDFLGPMA